MNPIEVRELLRTSPVAPAVPECADCEKAQVPSATFLLCPDQPKFKIEEGTTVSVRRAQANTPREDCPKFWEAAVAEGIDSDFVVMISPWIRTFGEVASGLKKLLTALKDAPSAFYGALPYIDMDRFPGRFQTGASTLRHQFWRAHYSDAAAPSFHSRNFAAVIDGAEPVDWSRDCFASDAGSSTRVYNTSQFQRLIRLKGERLTGEKTQGILMDGVDAQEGRFSLSSWYADLDLTSQSLGIAALTCMYGLLDEQHYLASAQLTPWLAWRHGIEVADFKSSTSQS